MIATQEQLKQMQSKEIELFKVFLEACEKMHLQYFIVGGTLLGAVRHGGFIPWDDDIDVVMLRKDYDIFVQQAAQYLPNGMFLQSCHSEPDYHSNMTKIRDCNSTYIESGLRFSRINHGVFIDIFPLDNYPTNTLERFRVSLFKKILSARINEVFFRNQRKANVKELTRAVMVAVMPSLQETVKLREKLYRSVKYTGTLINHSGMWGEKEIVPANWFTETCQLQFEGLTVTAPKEYDKMLTHFYGNYMELPPVEKRVTHHLVDVVDLERPYTDYMDV